MHSCLHAGPCSSRSLRSEREEGVAARSALAGAHGMPVAICMHGRGARSVNLPKKVMLQAASWLTRLRKARRPAHTLCSCPRASSQHTWLHASQPTTRTVLCEPARYTFSGAAPAHVTPYIHARWRAKLVQAGELAHPVCSCPRASPQHAWPHVSQPTTRTVLCEPAHRL